MCGRFFLKVDPALIEKILLLDAPIDYEPRYNVAPGTDVLVVRSSEAGRRVGAFLRWGLVPRWATDPSIGARLLNARAETAAEKPSFREALQRRRCLIPADGFFEWRKRGKERTAMCIRGRGDELLTLAGLWERWTDPSGAVLETCAVLTTEPNELLTSIHDRMPLILPPEHRGRWLDPKLAPERITELLRPYPAARLRAYPVSPWVNKAGNEGPRTIEPLVAATTGLLFPE